MSIKLLGTIQNFSSSSNELTVKLGFLSPEKMEVIEELFTEKSLMSFSINKPRKASKTHKQLKMYHRVLKLILEKREIDVTSSNLKALDIHMKKSLLLCDTLILEDKTIPIVPSKANLSIEEMTTLIQRMIELYDIDIKEIQV